MDSDNISGLNGKLYRAIDVWKRVNDNCAIRYRCFEILGENMYCVQSADYFYYPIDDNQMRISGRQMTELFIESSPDERSETYSSLEEAIRMHEGEFKTLAGKIENDV